jgi:tyrosine-protein kinase Etk/Wzc
MYQSSAVIMPPVEEGQQSFLEAWMSNMDLPSMIVPMSAGRTRAQILQDILRSRRLRTMIVDSLELKNWYGISSMDETLGELQGRTGITVSQTGLLDLSVRDRDPEMAAGIVGMYISSLDSLNRILEFTRAGNTMKFISEQLDRYERKLEVLRDSIADFQQRNGIADFSEQTEGAIEVAVNLKLKQVLTGIELELLREYSSDKTVALRSKRAEYNKLTDKLEGMMEGEDDLSIFIPLRELPRLKQQYAAMTRDLEVAERVYSFLLERYQESGIDRARTTPSVQVVSYPNVPDEPAGIPAWAVVILAALAGALWISAVILFWSWLSGRKRGTEEERAFRELTELFKSDLRNLRRFLRI